MIRHSLRPKRSRSPLTKLPSKAISTFTYAPVPVRAAVSITIAFLAGFSITSLCAETPQDTVTRAHQAAQRSAVTHHALSTIAPQDASDTPSTPAPVVIDQGAQAEPPPAPEPPKIKKRTTVPKNWVEAGLDPTKAELIDGRYVQQLDDGSKVTLTLEPKTQRELEKLYAQYKIPYGGVVLLEPSTGRVLAMISHSSADKKQHDQIARQTIAPSASVFKVVTAAALLESVGVSPEQKVCYHGGRSSLTKRNIKGDARRDTRCGNLSDAVTWSINSLIAKLAYKHLSQKTMNRWAKKFGYNTQIPFELPIEISRADSVADPFERARQAAGFWHSHLSPMHGALIGAAVQNDGVMMRPTLVQAFHSADGEPLYEFKPKRWRRVMKTRTAKTLKKMMRRTSTVGTARKYFKHRKGFPNDIIVGGKTGTLSRKKPSYLGYTWFVGFAQAQEDRNLNVSVGGVICNKPLWHIKGTYAASEAVRTYIQGQRKIRKRRKKQTKVASSR